MSTNEEGVLLDANLDDLIFRLRSADALLGERQELLRQSIFFASPREQNDPMEGAIDLRWLGDAILWRNFFMHHFRCLYLTYGQLVVGGADVDLEIPVFVNSKSFPGMEKSADFRLAKAKFLGNCDLRKAARLLGQRSREMGEQEVRSLLNTVHHLALHAITSSLKQLPAFSFPKPSTSLSILIAQTDRVVAENPDPEKIEALHRKLNSAIDEMLLISEYNSSEIGENAQRNRRIMAGDFPRLYLEKIRGIVHASWYAACFVQDYTNSSMWSHYADNHTGACLVYRPEKDKHGKRVMCFEGIIGFGTGPKGSDVIRGNAAFEFKRVKYSGSFQRVDFFATLGRLSASVIESDWYSDGARQSSKTSPLLAGGSRSVQNYWDQLEMNALNKTKDWSYENEERLLLYGTLGDKNAAERLFRYNFESLHGIIFGINMPYANKIKISKIIEAKCAEEGRKDFAFYQAFFDPISSGIQVEQLDFLKFKR